MKYILIIIIITFTTSITVAGKFQSTNDLIPKMREFQKAAKHGFNDDTGIDYEDVLSYLYYTIGVYDATFDNYTVSNNVNQQQIGLIVAKYIDKHPEHWHYAASRVIQAALIEAFPKRRQESNTAH